MAEEAWYKDMKNPFWRSPDYYIGPDGNPTMFRWHILPRNRWFNMYLHKFVRSDRDPFMHDHPYDNMSILLRGRYVEQLKTGQLKMHKAPCIILRRAETPHRVLLHLGDPPTWTLFIHLRRRREWGFYVPEGWLPYKEYQAKYQQ